MKRYSFILTACMVVLLSCQHPSSNKPQTMAASDTPVSSAAFDSIHYAKGFKVERHDGWCLLEVSDPQDARKTKDTYRFALVSKSDADVPSGLPRIQVPVRNVICTTTLQLSGFLKLHALDHISGIMSAKRLFSPELKRRIEEGSIVKVGKEGNFDTELILASQPSAILVSLSKRGGFDKLEDLGFPLIPYMGYQETSPLAQAEWIKFVGLLTGRESASDSIFHRIEQSYLSARDSLKAFVQSTQANQSQASGDPASARPPFVLYGKLHGDNWYAMGGGSFISQICSDAGAFYFMAIDSRSGGINLDFEYVYSMASDVDFWVVQNKDREPLTYSSLAEEDARYADFRPWKERRIICCDMSQTPINELSPMEPDTILLDFIHAIHPGYLKDYHPKYYQILQH